MSKDRAKDPSASRLIAPPLVYPPGTEEVISSLVQARTSDGLYDGKTGRGFSVGGDEQAYALVLELIDSKPELAKYRSGVAADKGSTKKSLNRKITSHLKQRNLERR